MHRWMAGCFAVAAMLFGAATAGASSPNRMDARMHVGGVQVVLFREGGGGGGNVPPEVDANEVCLYRHVDFAGTAVCHRLEPGMRHRLVPTLGGMNDLASSVQVGEGVEVVLFEHAHFGGKSHLEYQGNPVISNQFNDKISSMIIRPKRTKEEGGELWGKDTVFYPLPERLTESEARYPNLGGMNNTGTSLGVYGDVEVTLYEHANFAGKALTLPDVNSPPLPPGSTKRFDLQKYQFDKMASSIIVRTARVKQKAVPINPPTPPPRGSEVAGEPHRAPPAVTPQTAKVLQTDSPLEMDTNRPGQDYRSFDLDVPEPKRCQRTCLDDPKCKAWTYVKPGVQGPKARCWLKSGVPAAKPNTCCVSGVKAQ